MADVVGQDGIRILKEQCSTCIFRPGNLMYLRPGRVKQMVDETLKTDGGHITCHDTLPYSPHGPDIMGAICRGYWDRYRQRHGLFQMAERMSFVKEVDRPEDREKNGD